MNPQEVFKNTKDAVMPDAVKNGTTFYGTSKKTDFEKRMYGEKDGDTKSQSKEKLKEKKKAGGLGILFYFFGLVIVAVSLITLKIDVVSSLLGAGILVLPLSLIFVITKKKYFFWYSVFAYLCFIVAGLSQKALFASLGILFASLIFGGTILYQK